MSTTGDDLFGVGRAGEGGGIGPLGRHLLPPASPPGRETLAGQVDQNPPHTQARQCEEVAAVAHPPAAPRQAVEPKLVNQLGLRDRCPVTFSPQLTERDLLEPRKNLADQGVGSRRIALHKELQPYG
jgi:hypothetical protein